jgi:hypothetical protein
VKGLNMTKSKRAIITLVIVIVSIIIAIAFFIKLKYAPNIGYIDKKGETLLLVKGYTYDIIEDKHWNYIELDKDIGGMDLYPLKRYYSLKNDPNRIFIQPVEFLASMNSWIQKRTDISLPELSADNVQGISCAESLWPKPRPKPVTTDDSAIIRRIMELYLNKAVNDEPTSSWSGGLRLYLYFKGFSQVCYEIEILRSDIDEKYYMKQYVEPNKIESTTVRIPDDLVSLLINNESE